MRVFVLLIILAQSSFSMPLIGVSNDDITPSEAVPIGGYGDFKRRIIPWDFFSKYPNATFFKPSEGKLDPIRVKALAFIQGERKLILASFDVVGITGSFKEDIENKLKDRGLRDFELIVTATHTHHGPGGLAQQKAWQLMAMDRFIPWLYDRYVDAAAEQIEKAINKAKPANLYVKKLKLKGFSRNRGRYHKLTDDDAYVFEARDQDNNVLGGFFHYGIHPTLTPLSLHKFSADLSGHFERTLQSIHPDSTFMHIQAAQGDINANFRFEEILLKMETLKQIYNAAPANMLELDWTIITSDYKLKRAGRLNAGACMRKKWFSKWLRFPLRKIVPKKGTAKTLKLSNYLIHLWPGEPTVYLANELKKNDP
jgi:hypothetical protein